MPPSLSCSELAVARPRLVVSLLRRPLELRVDVFSFRLPRALLEKGQPPFGSSRSWTLLFGLYELKIGMIWADTQYYGK